MEKEFRFLSFKIFFFQSWLRTHYLNIIPKKVKLVKAAV